MICIDYLRVLKYKYIYQKLSKCLHKVGFCIGRHPLLFICIPLLFTALFASGFLRMKAQSEKEFPHLLLNEKSIIDRSEIEKLFAENATDFDFSRTTRLKAYGSIIAKTKDGGSMLRESIFQEIQKLDWMVRNMTVTHKKRNLTYADICRKTKEICFRNDVLNLVDKLSTFLRGRIQIRYPNVMNAANTYGINLGGVSTDDDGFVKDFKAIRLFYFIDDNNSTQHLIAKKWEDRFLNSLEGLSLHHINISGFSGSTWHDKLSSVSTRIIPYIIVTVLAVVFLIISIRRTTKIITDKPIISIIAGCFPCFSAVSAFGCLLLCDMEYFDINLIIFFVLLIISWSDSLLIFKYWCKTNIKDSVEKRMSETYSKIVVSITISYLINIMSCLFGIIMPFKLTQEIFIYLCFSLLINYVYQITFYGGWLAISGHIEAKQSKSIFLTRITLDLESNNPSVTNTHLSRKKSNIDNTVKKKCYTGNLLTKPMTKIVILLIFFIHLCGGTYFFRYSSPSSNYSQYYQNVFTHVDYINDEVKYFSNYRDRIQLVIDKQLDYSDSEIQNKIENLIISLERLPNMDGSRLSKSWLREFLTYVNSSESHSSLTGYNMSDPQHFIKALFNVFLKLNWTKSFKKDIILSKDGKTILASRFFIQTNLIDNSRKENWLIDSIFNVTDYSNIPVRAFSYRFIYYKQYDNIMYSMGTFLLINCIVIMLIFPLSTLNFVYVIFSLFSVASIAFTTVGYMLVWKVKFNAIIMIIQIVTTIFSVKCLVNASYVYIKSKKKTPNGKMRDAVSNIIPFILSSLILIIYILLMFIPYDTSANEFKIVFIAVTSIIFYNLFVVPTVFSSLDYFWINIQHQDEKLSNEKGCKISENKELLK
ncbi:patched domain-containing protein 3-like [Centruroides vittatus]|uniref:patched domain-containing protein 3-like n=1 Tax=Centruroides vittatus TaxID=120091 RepID=UPI00350EBEA8